MSKTKIIPFNNLPLDERNKITYYKTETQILTIQQCISLLDDSVGEYQKRKLREWQKNCERYLEKEYELSEVTND